LDIHAHAGENPAASCDESRRLIPTKPETPRAGMPARVAWRHGRAAIPLASGTWIDEDVLIDVRPGDRYMSKTIRAR
jgi:hypothetical protein